MEKSKLLIKRLELIALALGITASQIEKGCGVHRSQLPKIWKGESDPSLTKFCILDAFIFECLSNAHPTKAAQIWQQIEKAGLGGNISTMIITPPEKDPLEILKTAKSGVEELELQSDLEKPPLRKRDKKTFDKVVKTSEAIVKAFELPDQKPVQIGVDLASGKDTFVQQAACGCKMENSLFRRAKGCIIPKDKHYFINL